MTRKLSCFLVRLMKSTNKNVCFNRYCPYNFNNKCCQFDVKDVQYCSSATLEEDSLDV